MPEQPAVDRRVQRSRAALMAAAVRLVSERGTTALPVAEFTEAANVSRKLLYMHFGDRDGLLVAAAIDLVERELLPRTVEMDGDLREHVLATVRHFAEHRPFYRPMLTGPCAFAMTTKQNSLLGSLSRDTVRDVYGDLEQQTLNDLALVITSGVSAVVNDWLINADDPLDPDAMTDRLQRMASALINSRSGGGRVR
ncbi:DNA-binding transcriptional regulator, AcrR family [Nonomuraea solani]|uniref:DNA-binding transcriptional regulator, AcrR family n=2 Tax=Nonomuraea solani TaxID=1144553 RepID=A0A1H6F209_9ACTN|nr:DNA-binding transcriptional regulator, AcrR family [Nonomuraea solani]